MNLIFNKILKTTFLNLFLTIIVFHIAVARLLNKLSALNKRN